MPLTHRILERLIENSPLGIQLVDNNGMTVRLNQAVLDLFGYASDREVVGVVNLLSDPSMERYGLRPFIEQAFRGETVKAPPLRLNREGLPGVDVQTTLFPINDEQGNLAFVALLHEDVTALRASLASLERRYAQIASLEQSYSIITNELEPERVVDETLLTSQRMLFCDAAAIWRYEAATTRWKCLGVRGLSRQYVEDVEIAYQKRDFEISPAEEVLLKRGLFAADDIRSSEIEPSRREALLKEGMCRMLALPMQSHDAVVGSLSIYWREPGPIDALDTEVARLLADQSAIALHNAELYEETHAAAVEAQILYEATAILNESLDIATVVQAMTDRITPLMGLDRASVRLLDPERQELRMIAMTGVTAEELEAVGHENPQPLDQVDPLVREMLDTGKPLVLSEIGEELLAGMSPEKRAALEAAGLRSIMLFPLRDGATSIGYMTFDERGARRQWTARDERIARGIAAQVAAAIRNGRLYEETIAMRNSLEEKVRERTEALREAHETSLANERLAAVGILAREVAHNLRNPLNVISASVYYLRSRFPKPDEKVTRHFDTVARSVQQAADTINQLMGLVDADTPVRNSVDLLQVTRRALSELESEDQVLWNADLDPDTPYVNGDITRITHVVKSLLNNAAAAAPIDSEIQVRLGKVDTDVVFSVGDCREPVSHEELIGMFEPLFASATRWTGLALNVARRIARKHGGDVTCSISETDDRTWFSLRLPAADRAAPPCS